MCLVFLCFKFIFFMYQTLKKYNLITLHVMVLILGFTGILGKLISIEATYLVWYRMLIAFLALFVFLLIKKEAFNIPKRFIFPILGIGVIVALHWYFFFESIKVSNVSVAVVCLATSSLFSALIEPIFFKRKLKIYEVIFAIIVLLALAYVVDADISYRLGYIYGILAAFLGTLFTIFNARLIKKVDAAKITMLEMLSGTILLSILFLFQYDYTVFTSFISLHDFTYLFILGTLCTAGVFVWMTEIMRYITPYSLIMAINLEPIYSIILALLLFGESEKMNLPFYVGSSIILIVIFLEGYLQQKNKKKQL